MRSHLQPPPPPFGRTVGLQSASLRNVTSMCLLPVSTAYP